MSLKLTTWVSLLLLFPFVGAWAQSSILNSYVEEGLENNLALQRQQLSYEKSLEALKEARGLFLPAVSFNATYTLAQGGRLLQFPIGDLLNPVYGTLNQLTESQSFPTIENEDIQFLPNNFQETRINVTQPLFNSDIYFNYKAKQALIEVEKVSREVYKIELIKEIQTAYLGYLQTLEAIQILDETEVLLGEVQRVNQKLVNVQKSTRETLIQTDYEITDVDQQRASIVEKRQNAQAYVNFLLNKPLGEELKVDSSLLSLELGGNLEELTQKALSQRPEIDQLNKAQEANEWAVRRFQYANLPKVGASLDMGFQGFGYNWRDPEQAYFLAGFSLTWDLYKGGQNKSRRQQALIDQRALVNQQNEVQKQIELQLRQAYYAVNAASQKEDASRKALVSAKENFRILQKKYTNQQASFLEFLQARTNLTRSRLDLSVAHFDYLSKLAELSYAAGTYR